MSKITTLITGSMVMGITAAAANYFLLLPMFEAFMPLDQIIESFGMFIPFFYKRLTPVLKGNC